MRCMSPGREPAAPMATSVSAIQALRAPRTVVWQRPAFTSLAKRLAESALASLMMGVQPGASSKTMASRRSSSALQRAWASFTSLV